MSLDQFLKKFIVSEKGAPVNYTKIGNTDLNVYGNKYFIPEDKTTEFYNVYKKHVFKDKKEAYLTEKQLDCGKILIDLDFRYEPDVSERQHTKDHITDLVELIINGFCEIFKDIEGKTIEFYIFEKDNLNMSSDDVTKDGIHMIINIDCDFAVKMILRDYLIQNLADIWDDIPIKNSWSDVVDEGVMKGHVNWQLYGSRKPGYESYKLKYMFEAIVEESGNIDLNEPNLALIDFDKYFPLFCARNKNGLLTFRISDDKQDVYEQYKQEIMMKKSGKSGAAKLRKKSRNITSYEDICSEDDLNDLLTDLFDNPNTPYKIKEIHNYTMLLTKEYWGPGSYDKWIRVGWALRNSNVDIPDVLFLTWMKMSSKSPDFTFECNDLYDHWCGFDTNNRDGLTDRSIIYWAKQCNPEEYDALHKKTVDYHIYYSFYTKTEVDLASTLKCLYKSQFVCASMKEKLWYEFLNNRWVPTDCGVALRLKISNEMYQLYSNKVFEYQMMANAIQNNIAVDDASKKTEAAKKESENEASLNPLENKIMNDFKDTDGNSFSDFKKKTADMIATTKLLKKTSTKGNIMKEAEEQFYEKEFISKLDKDPYLLGCTNCVIDFREKRHRKGKHDDYIHKTTGMNYKPLSYYQQHSPHVIKEINTFFEQLFPNTELRGYMWEHLASTLMGTNENQTFNIYTGSGANGKSKLVELMNLVLGEYKGTVPISLVTQKRTNIGSTSSEIYSLIGTRYAVMQEPSKGDKINEGIMKELTGGDPIQCRALFKDSVTFIPQFKLVVCTNTLFDIVSNDDGTWRRLRKVDFESKFTKNPYNDPKFPTKEYPYQFELDPKIDEKFEYWAPVLLAMLVEIAYKTQGIVKDVDVVLAATENYRQAQDIFLEFINTFINQAPDPHGIPLKFRDAYDVFKDWHNKTYGSRRLADGKEVQTYMEHRFGKMPSSGWRNISLKRDVETIDEMEENEKDFC